MTVKSAAKPYVSWLSLTRCCQAVPANAPKRQASDECRVPGSTSPRNEKTMTPAVAVIDDRGERGRGRLAFGEAA